MAVKSSMIVLQLGLSTMILVKLTLYNKYYCVGLSTKYESCKKQNKTKGTNKRVAHRPLFIGQKKIKKRENFVNPEFLFDERVLVP